jgi:hypothetical protein
MTTLGVMLVIYLYNSEHYKGVSQPILRRTMPLCFVFKKCVSHQLQKGEERVSQGVDVSTNIPCA